MKHCVVCQHSAVVAKTGCVFLTFSKPILKFYNIIHCDFINWKITLQFTTNQIKVFLKENKDDKSCWKQQKLAKTITCGSLCFRTAIGMGWLSTLLSQSNFLSLRTTYPTGRFYKNGWLEKHNRHVALLKAKSNTLAVVIGDSIAAGLIRYKSVWDENSTEML